MSAQPKPLPVVVVDTREQTPLPFRNLPTIAGTLATGDYSFLGGEELFTVERKSLADLTGCCCGDNRARFERELHRLRGYRFKRLLVVGSMDAIEGHRYASKVHPHAVRGSLAAWEVRYDIPVIFAPDPAAAAVLVERWVAYYAREIGQTAAAVQRLPATTP